MKKQLSNAKIGINNDLKSKKITKVLLNQAKVAKAAKIITNSDGSSKNKDVKTKEKKLNLSKNSNRLSNRLSKLSTDQKNIKVKNNTKNTKVLSLEKSNTNTNLNAKNAVVAINKKSQLFAKKVKDTSSKARVNNQVKVNAKSNSNSRIAPRKINDIAIKNADKNYAKNDTKSGAKNIKNLAAANLSYIKKIDKKFIAPNSPSLTSINALVPMSSEALARSANNPDFQQAMASVNSEVFKIKENTKPLVFPPPSSEFRPPRSSLSSLVLENHWKELEKKLKGKFDPNARDEIGFTASWTPLYWSVKLGRVECVRLLLSFGADVNMVISDIDECSGTVLDLVSIRGDSAMEAMLREHVRKDEISINQAFRAIRTKLRGRAPAFNFRQYAK